jgi:type VI secretion system ImpC/EvpB family protein
MSPFPSRKPSGSAGESGQPREVREQAEGLAVDLEAILRAGVAEPVARGSEPAARELLAGLLEEPALRQLASGQPKRFLRFLGVLITRIDDLLNRQVNAILHHAAFQKLESSWRGLEFLHQSMQRSERDDVKLKILDASWQELEHDFQKQREFDQSFLFKAVYENEFGQAGGHPFGVLIGDFEICPRPSREHPHDDLSVMRSIGQVAAAAFCPFIAAASPAMFEYRDFSRLERSVDLERYFRDPGFFQWRKLREEEDTRFLGLTLPRVLMRLPYVDDTARVDGFCFREDVERGPDLSRYLWGNAAYAFASVILRSYSNTGWFVDTRGYEVRQDFVVDGGGLVPGLPVSYFGTDRPGVVPRPCTDVVISEDLERSLSELGFIPLCDCRGTGFSAFFSNRSIQKPARFGSSAADASARMSSMLQYMFCVSRFAHFLKVMARDLIGSLGTDDLQRHLNDWIAGYICDADSSTEVKIRHPLEKGRVSLVREPGKAGTYQCIIELKPHFELEEVVASVRLNTRLSGVRND